MTNPTDGAMPPLPPSDYGLCFYDEGGKHDTGRQGYSDEDLHAYAKAYAAPLVARVAELQAALELVLPMAKGYARVHNVGSNQAYCDQADAALTSNKEQQP